MDCLRTSLTTKIFLAIASTSVLVIGTMALLVALSMRDGFSQYLLRGEIARFNTLAQELALAHDPAAPGWPELKAEGEAWNAFVIKHFRPPGNPDGDDVKADPLMIGDRLTLLDAQGDRIAGATARSAIYEQRPICGDADCKDGAPLGYLHLNAPEFSDSTSDGFFIRGQYTSLAFSALIALLLSAAAAFLIARQILIPIKRLEVGAKTLASGDYSQRIEKDRTDELGDLIAYHNALAETLAKASQAEREWMSNTSHELQTPLAVLRAQIEALQDGVRQPNQETLAEMHAAQMRLSRLVQDLKILTHSREPEHVASFNQEDLVEVVTDAVRVARPMLETAGLEIDCAFPEALTLKCDRTRISQVIDNLLQNAARYTDPPGRIRLRIWHARGFAHVSIEDTPPTVPDDVLPRLFDRFFRAEGSRSRALGGSGLGLSVCEAIVEAHGGKISVATSELGGLNVTFTLPERRS